MSNRAGIGWSVLGHSGNDLPFYAYGPNHPVGLLENTDIPQLAAKAMGFNLAQFDTQYFIEVGTVFNDKTGWKTRVDQTDKANPVLIVEKGTLVAKLPVDKNYMMIGNKVQEFQGLTVFIAPTGRVYIPRQAVKIIMSNPVTSDLRKAS